MCQLATEVDIVVHELYGNGGLLGESIKFLFHNKPVGF